MARAVPFARLKAFALKLPEATLEIKWESPYFCVKGKIFAGAGDHGGRPSLTVKSDRATQAELLGRRGFFLPAYVGHAGWVGIHLDAVRWDEVKALLADSYRRVAPKKLAALIGPREPRKTKTAGVPRSRATEMGGRREASDK